MTTKTLAHGFATALAGLRPQATLRCLGLSALIACAGCGPRARENPQNPGEANATSYAMAGTLANGDGPVAALARRMLSDGYLSVVEANEMWAAHDAAIDADMERGKAEALARYGPASGTEARSDETPQSGSARQGDGPALKGDANNLTDSTP